MSSESGSRRVKSRPPGKKVAGLPAQGTKVISPERPVFP